MLINKPTKFVMIILDTIVLKKFPTTCLIFRLLVKLWRPLKGNARVRSLELLGN